MILFQSHLVLYYSKAKNNCCIGVTQPNLRLSSTLDIFVLFLMKKKKEKKMKYNQATKSSAPRKLKSHEMEVNNFK